MFAKDGQDILSRPEIVSSVIGIVRQMDVIAAEDAEFSDVQERPEIPEVLVCRNSSVSV